MDPITISALIGGGASLLGGLFSNKQAEQRQEVASEFNAEQARLNREFSASQAAQQMEFQREMSGSSYQRAVGDLSLAGLNPMLAYSQGGASTPSGAMGAGSSASASAAPVHNIGEGISSAMMQAAQIENVKANTELTKQKTETETNETEIRHYGKQRIRVEIENMEQKWDLTNAEIKRVVAETENLKEEKGVIIAHEYLQKIDMYLKDLSFPEAIAKANAWKSSYGQNARPYLDDVVKGASSAAALRYGSRGLGLRPSSGSRVESSSGEISGPTSRRSRFDPSSNRWID